MKKNLLLLVLSLFAMNFVATAQNEARVQELTVRSSQNNVNKMPPACEHFKIEYDHDATTATGGATGLAGATLVNDQIWISKWNSADLYILDTLGNFITSFQVPGLTGTRSLTFDGEYVYAGNATTTITKIDTATRLAVGTITSTQPARHCAWDSAAGGFWVGNWNTPIDLIDTTGALITSIAPGTHGMTSMYGSTVDHISPGGPYLWVFDQSQASSSAVMVQLSIPAGTPTGRVHDVASDVGLGQGNPLAGGLFVTDRLRNGKWVIGGLMQGSPSRAFAYSLDTTAFIDLNITKAQSQDGYTEIPVDQISQINFDVDLENESCSSTPLDFTIKAMVYKDGVLDYQDSTAVTGMASPNSSSYVYGPYLPSGVGNYEFVAYVDNPYADKSFDNDTLRMFFAVTDSSYARDNGVDGGSLGIGGNDDGALGQVFEIHTEQIIESIDFFLRSPNVGDSTKVIIYNFDDTNGPGSEVYVSQSMTIQSSDAGWRKLYMKDANTLLFAGKYLIAMQEYGDNLTLGTTTQYYTDNTNFFYLNGQAAWFDGGQNGFPVAYMLRANLYLPADLSVESLTNRKVSIVPNPAKGMVTIENTEVNGTIELLDVTGKVVLSQSSMNQTTVLNIADLNSGMYVVRYKNNDNIINDKLIIE